MRTLILIAVVAATPLLAQEWNLRESDTVLNQDQIAEQIVGRTLVFYDDGRSKFSAGGSYSYTYDGGDSAFGTFEVGADGIICISYNNGWTRCDKYVQSSERLVLLTGRGERFPIRP